MWLLSMTSFFPFHNESTFSEIASETSPSIIENINIPPELMETETILDPVPTLYA